MQKIRLFTSVMLSFIPFLIICLSVFNFLSAENSLFFTTEMMQSHLNSYHEDEKQAIAKDLDVVRSVCFPALKENPNDVQFYLATAGAPGARKSTILERFLATHPEFSNGVYLDPDQRGLKFMVHTYHQRSLNALICAEHQQYAEVEKNAYEKWRGASNYITIKLMEETFQKHLNVIHGATSTGTHIPFFFERLHAANYKIILLLCSCEDQFRTEALSYRINQQRYYQSTPKDFIEKGLLFSQKLKDYFTHADELYLFWSDHLFTPERLAAVYTSRGTTIYDGDAYEKFIQKYEKDRENLKQKGIEIPSWQQLSD